MFDFKFKNVLITGGSKGIGAACINLFALNGANVAFTYFSSKKNAQKLVDKFDGTIKIKAYKVNISEPGDIEKSVENILNDFGSVDILVNNAGIWKEGAIDKLTLDQWRETITVNLESVFLFTKFILPSMKKKKFGKIINISSTAAQRGEAFYSHYASSKGAIISFTKSLAAELGKYNININSVAPGWVYSDMTKKVFVNKKYLKSEINKIPLGRIATPDDIAGPVLFLASDYAKHITGEVLNVNGGSVLCG